MSTVATTRERETVELRLVVIRPDGKRGDVSVEATHDARARELVSALAAELHLDPAAAVARRNGEELSGDAPVSELGLRQGDELRFGPPEHIRDEAAPVEAAPVELVVVGGLDAGRRRPLAYGVHRVGREASVALDDPSLSAHHLLLTVMEDGAVAVADAGSRNGTAVEGVPLAPGEERSLEEGELVQAGRTLLGVEQRAAVEPPGPPADGAGRIPFNRPPRVQRPLDTVTRPFPAPPNDPQGARLPLAASLIPLVLGVGLYVLTRLPTMLFFSLLAPVMALTTYIEDRRGGRKGFERHRREYRRRLAELRGELDATRRDEAARRRAQAPSVPELLRRARRREPTLWERRPDDRDFLALRVGSADQPALLTVKLEPGGSEALRREAEQLAAWYATSPAVPVVVPFADLGVIGLCGPHARVEALGRSLVAQAAALHSPSDLAIAAALDADRLAGWDWLKWLPHTQGESGAPSARLASDRAGARVLLEELTRVVSERRADAEQTYGPAARRGRQQILLVLDEAVAPERALVGGLLAGAAGHGVSVMWLGRDRRDLPGECAGIVALDPHSARLAYTDARGGGEWTDVSADGVSVDVARELALALAPVRDAGGSRSEGIPDRVALLDLLEGAELDAEWVRDRWAAHHGALGAVVGAAASGPFAIDLRADGPHGLVAGMTGAGKSELLQTLIASLAASHPPNRLAFLLVDYKGGAAFKDCVRLPHTVGLVTDLDAHLTQRALASLNAELQRRERILRDSGAKDLAEMERRVPDDVPPSLLIVIDEFATLAKEVPDFVDGIVDVAQRGRSLGVHLLLATQRPGGIVSENIRANTNLRIALRVNEAGESSDVIGAPDAARIPRDRPGRAYARTGHSELTQLQTAYVGGLTVHATREATVVVRRFGFDTRGTAAKAAEESGETDLARLVVAAREAASMSGIEPPPSPWLPPLVSVLPLEALTPPVDAAVVVLGLVDEPQRQHQRQLTVDLEHEGSLLVYGASGAGKTTLLRTLALSLAERASPDELHVYGLDFATRGLTPLAELPHTGAIVGGDDEERTERLFALLRATLERRKLLLAQAGVFTLSEYRRLPAVEPLPRIVVLLDGYAGFAAAFERVNLGALVDALPRLVADGRPLGVHFAISADRRGAVPNALAGIVPTKIVLRMADEDEFAALGVPPKVVRGAQIPPGRGFLPGGAELQVALGETLDAAGELRRRYPRAAVPSVEPLPTAVPRGALPLAERRWAAVLGVGDAELEAVTIDLSARHFLVAGPYRSGRSFALRTVVESLRSSTPGLELHLLAPRRSPLVELAGWSSVAEGGDRCDEAVLRLGELAASPPPAPVLVVIDDGEELAESLGAAPLETVVRRGRDIELRVLAAAERSAAQRAFSGWLRELRKEEHGLLLDPDLDVDGDILGTRLPRRSSPVFPPGRGYFVERGSVELVQVAE
jgi:S-DNA-T family DNA segregation ATPase FtsK/SpoIIIE